MLALIVLMSTWCIIVMVDAHDAVINYIQCGGKQRNGKIVGGTDAIPGEFPWLVSITRRGGHFCGGSLITSKHVLTAAHCICNGVDGFLKPASIKITVGQHSLIETGGNSYEMAVSVITAHPEYRCNKVRNDIAILELDSGVTWSDSVQPACLSRIYACADDSAMVAGWGWTSENNSKVGVARANQLQKAQVSVLSNEVCSTWYKSQGKKTRIQESQMCAGRQQGGIDACWADSGGPLMVNNEHAISMIGVVSTGIGCARPYLPGIYTRIPEFVPWIQSELEK